MKCDLINLQASKINKTAEGCKISANKNGALEKPDYMYFFREP